MKKGILAVSFGTSHIDTMEKTIDVLEKEFAKTFEEAVRSRFAPFVDFPIIFASALQYDYKKIKAHCKYKGANSRRSFRKNGGRWDRRSYRSADSCDQRDRK